MADGEITGRCLCGGVTYSAGPDAVAQAACHCEDCQRQTGNPFSVLIGVPRDALEVEGSSLASYTTTGEDHGGETQRYFCSNCGSPVYSASPLLPEVAFIKAGSLDDASWLEPNIEVWTSSASPGLRTSSGSARFERGPG